VPEQQVRLARCSERSRSEVLASVSQELADGSARSGGVVPRGGDATDVPV